MGREQEIWKKFNHQGYRQLRCFDEGLYCSERERERVLGCLGFLGGTLYEAQCLPSLESWESGQGVLGFGSCATKRPFGGGFMLRLKGHTSMIEAMQLGSSDGSVSTVSPSENSHAPKDKGRLLPTERA